MLCYRPVKQTLQSKMQVPAKVQVCRHAAVLSRLTRRQHAQRLHASGDTCVQVKLPRALFEPAVQSGNSLLVERSVRTEASRPAPGRPGGAPGTCQRAPLAGHMSLLI